MLLYKLERESNKADSEGYPQRSFEANNQFILYSRIISWEEGKKKRAAAEAAPGHGAVGKRHTCIFFIKKSSLSNDNAP